MPSIVALEDMDVTTCFFSFHEIPHLSRQNIIKRMKQYTKYKIIIVDISPYYNPKKIMLKGEPFLKEYLVNILEFVAGNNLLKSDGILVIEDDVRSELELNNNFKLIEKKNYGKTQLIFLIPN